MWKEKSQDGRVGGHRVCVSSQVGHLLGTGGGLQTPKGTGGIPELPRKMLEERRVRKKWRQDRTSTPEGVLGKRRGSHAQRGPHMERGSAGMEKDLWGIRGSEGNEARVSPACLGLVWLQASNTPGPPPAMWVLGLNPPTHQSLF